MNLTRCFELERPRDEIVERLCRDETLLGLLARGDTQIVESAGDRRTIRTEYLGRQLTFHFTFLMDGNVRFEKVCDGNVWRELKGYVGVEELSDQRSRVSIELSGRTRSLIPEFTIKAPLEDQLLDMGEALEELLRG
jgi:hypothetical protein